MFLNKWLFIGVGALALGGALWVQTARLDAAQKEAQAADVIAKQWQANFTAAEAANLANLAAIAKLEAEMVRADQIAANEAARASALDARLKGIEREMATKDDGPVAPVLGYVLNSLRDTATSPGGRD